jgi:hypothetical protein
MNIEQFKQLKEEDKVIYKGKVWKIVDQAQRATWSGISIKHQEVVFNLFSDHDEDREIIKELVKIPQLYSEKVEHKKRGRVVLAPVSAPVSAPVVDYLLDDYSDDFPDYDPSDDLDCFLDDDY